MKTPEQIREQGLALTRATSTKTLVASFGDSDRMIDKLRAATPFDRDEYLAIVEARGWIMEVLDERGEIGLVMDAS